MARLAGVDIPNEKRIEIALTYIFGVGRTRAKETLEATGISPDTRVKDLTDEQLITLRDYLESNYKIALSEEYCGNRELAIKYLNTAIDLLTKQDADGEDVDDAGLHGEASGEGNGPSCNPLSAGGA